MAPTEDKTTYYELAVDDRDGGKRWSTFRRFQEFWHLNETLKSSPVVCDLVRGLDFPEKKWLFYKSVSVVEDRRVKLNTYLRVCAGMSTVATHPSFVAFIRPTPIPGDTSRASLVAEAVSSSLSTHTHSHAHPASSWEDELGVLQLKLTSAIAEAGETPEVSDLLWNIGLRAKAHGKLEEAISWYTRALALQESTVGPADLRVARTCNSLGNACQALTRHDLARAHYARAMEIQEAKREYTLVAETLVNLGCLSEGVGDLMAADMQYSRALALQTEHLGDHHDTAATLSNMGCMYQSLRKFAEAEAALVRAVDILQRLARSSTDTVLMNDAATALLNLAGLYKKLRALEKAEDCYTRATAMLEHAHGKQSLEVGRCLNNQANLLKKQGKLEAAEALYERTVAIRTHALGDSPDTANALYNLALLYEMEDKLADAETTFARVMEMFGVLGMSQQREMTKHYHSRVQQKRSVLDKPASQLLHK